jgi:ribokinase
MREVTVVGSVNVDLVVRGAPLPGVGETVVGGVFEVHPGGKGANQAVAAARAGARVRFIGCVGDDEHGRLSRVALEGEGIDLAGLAVVDAPTGVAIIAVDGRGRNQISVAPGANGLVRCDGEHDLLLAQLETPWSLPRARTVVLNPAPAAGVDLAGVDLVVPNEVEAAQLTGESDPARAAVALERAGAGVALVTLGEGGVWAQGEVHPAFDVPVVDSTGAGDTFVGAYVAALALGLPEPLVYAQAAAALAVQRPGARAAPTRSEIEAFLGGSPPRLGASTPPGNSAQ